MIKRLGKLLIHKMGYEIRRARRGSAVQNAFQVQARLLSSLGVTRPCILDVGANRGQTVQNYKKAFGRPTVHCFEPFPASVLALKASYADDADVTVVPMGIADVPGTRCFHVNAQAAATNSLLPRETRSRRYYPKRAELNSTIQVKVTTIDDYLSTSGIDRADILKMDIQGGELMALKGGSDALSDKRFLLVYTEAFLVPHYDDSPLLRDLWECLDSFGYTLYDMFSLRRATNGQLRYADVLFVSPLVRENVIDCCAEEP